MQKKLIDKAALSIPQRYEALLEGAQVFDSSCSKRARVYYINKGGGLYLKTAAKGTLEREALMLGYFAQKGLAPSAEDYYSEECDWLLMQSASGESCISENILSEPKKLCDVLGETLRMLHSVPFCDCPVENAIEDWVAAAKKNSAAGYCDRMFSELPERIAFSSVSEAAELLEKAESLLLPHCLIHGDACLPNIMLKDWRFSAFIDLGSGGVGDRHIDIFWTAMSLIFNLGTDAYRSRFYDAYGKELIDEEKIRAVAAVESFSNP